MLRRYLFLASLGTCGAEWALVNLIRHGERTQDSMNPHLAEAGYERAEYIAKCVAGANSSLAFPLGRPTRLMASLRPGSKTQKASFRPYETLEPLMRRLSLPIDNYVDMTDVAGFVHYVQKLRAGETLFVAWQHWFLTLLVGAFGFEGLLPTSFPHSCAYPQWKEPAYALDPEEGDCYDVIWQIVLFRPHPHEDWRIDSFAQYVDCLEATPFAGHRATKRPTRVRILARAQAAPGLWWKPQQPVHVGLLPTFRPRVVGRGSGLRGGTGRPRPRRRPADGDDADASEPPRPAARMVRDHLAHHWACGLCSRCCCHCVRSDRRRGSRLRVRAAGAIRRRPSSGARCRDRWR